MSDILHDDRIDELTDERHDGDRFDGWLGDDGQLATPPSLPPPRPPAAPPSFSPPAPSPPARSGAGRRRALAVAAVAALGLGSGYAGGLLAEHGGSAPATSTRVTNVSFTGAALDVAAVVDAVKASIVSVDTRITVQQGPFSQQGTGAGTGVVLDTAGHILTNAHVVADATSITVTLNGETKARAATLVASDTSHDIAVLKVSDTTGLVPAPFGSSSTLAVGDEVVAIGNALALEGGMSVTKGIVSALDRTITTSSGTLSGLLQTDAAISSGNSGGPLVDATGHVIGINSAVAASYGSVTASNIGFAIAIDDALGVAKQLIG